MKMDGRSHDHKTLETIRRMAVQRVHDGEKPAAVIASYGMHRTVIYKWLKADRENGVDALAAKKPTGRPSKLTDKQKQQVKEWINGKNPRQYGFDFGLWTRRRAYQRDPVAVAQWKEHSYPALRKRAKEAGGDIFFLDEAGIRSDAPLGRTWAPRGERPVVYKSGDRQSVNAISAVNHRGGFWYETYAGTLTADRFIEFLRKFVKAQRGKRVFIVLDRLSVHRAKAVMQYVDSGAGYEVCRCIALSSLFPPPE
jgi:transposase